MMYVLHTINSVQLGDFFFFGIGFRSLVSVVGLSVYYCSHIKLENEILLNIHCNVEKHEKPKHGRELGRGAREMNQTQATESCQKELKGQSNDDDLICRAAT